MKNISFLTGAVVVSSLSSQAQQAHIVYSENFNTPPFAVERSTNGVTLFDGAATGDVETGEWFTASNGVASGATTLDFTQEAKNKTRGAAVWLDTADWVAGTVTVTFDISDFIAPVGAGSGAFVQAYTASGVDASNTVGLDIHEGSSGVTTAMTGAATISTLDPATAITGAGTSLTHTFTYGGEERIALVFANQAANETDASTAAFSLDNLSVVAQTTRPAQPNIVLLLADDLGWQDVKCYDIYDLGESDDPSTPGVEGSQSIFETPYMDALAAQGVQFWQGYSPAPTCAPSRGAMMAGKHPARVQRHHVAGGTVAKPDKASSRMMVPFYSGRLPVAETTIPEVLTPLGYFTGHVGKWHIAISHNAYPQPMDHGFDWTEADRGITSGMGDRNDLANYATSDPSDPYQLDANGFAKDQTTLNALNFMTEAVTGALRISPSSFISRLGWCTHRFKFARKACLKNTRWRWGTSMWVKQLQT